MDKKRCAQWAIKRLLGHVLILFAKKGIMYFGIKVGVYVFEALNTENGKPNVNCCYKFGYKWRRGSVF